MKAETYYLVMNTESRRETETTAKQNVRPSLKIHKPVRIRKSGNQEIAGVALCIFARGGLYKV